MGTTIGRDIRVWVVMAAAVCALAAAPPAAAAATNIIFAVAGTGTGGFAGDTGPHTLLVTARGGDGRTATGQARATVER